MPCTHPSQVNKTFKAYVEKEGANPCNLLPFVDPGQNLSVGSQNTMGRKSNID